MYGTSIHTDSKIEVLTCVFQARASKLSTVNALRLSEAYENEVENIVWSDLLTQLRHVSQLLQELESPNGVDEKFDKLQQKLLNIYKQLTWEPLVNECTLTLSNILY